MQRTQTPGFRAFIIFAFIIAARFLSLVPIVIDDDEAWFSASAASLQHPGDFFLKALDNKPPGTVWYYWLVEKITHCGVDPRPARFFSILAAFLTAFLIARCVQTLSKNKQSGWLASAAFLMAAALPHPQMFATTTENLMLPLICFSMWIWFQAFSNAKVSLVKFFMVGVALSLLLFLKQTGVFFFMPACYALWALQMQRRFSRKGFLALVLGGILVQTLGFWAMSWNWQSYLYWTLIYPGTVLKSVRAGAFHENSDFFWNSLVVGLFIWPLIASCKSKAVLSKPGASRNLLFIWIGSAFATVAIGKGLFFHYYLYVVPPLCVAFGLAVRDEKKLRWFAYPYAAAALIVMVPASGMFWGVDQNYYSRLGAKVRELTPEHEKIFVWGGNALALVSSQRKFATRFVTARFAAAPYSTAQTQKDFQRDFEREHPSLVVDLHERGDCRFSASVASVPWLASELQRNYILSEDPRIPWAKFYRYRGPSRALASETTSHWQNASAFDFESVYEAMARSFGKNWFHADLLRRWHEALTMGQMLQAWDGLRVLVGVNPVLEQDREVKRRYEKLEFALKHQIQVVAHGSFLPSQTSADEFAHSMLTWLHYEFEDRKQPLPLSLQSPSWWVSVALVRMQPRTDIPTQHTL